MSKPKRQHYHPRSFLRPFADETPDGKHLVEVGSVTTREIKFPVGVADICVTKNLYTLPHVTGDDKYLVEKFYAEQIDGVYPDVYRMLVDPHVIRITEEQRQQILNTTLSLYFRNARFLNDRNQEVDQLFSRFEEKEFHSDDAKLFIRYRGQQYTFLPSEIAAVKEQIKLKNRQDFIFDHLQDWKDFVVLKKNSQIGVSKIEGDMKLITSDNPVRISNLNGDADEIFEPRNSIQLPIDRDHLLWISPNGEEWERDKIYRQVRDWRFALGSNYSVTKYASEWVIGPKGSIVTVFNEFDKYNKSTPENWKEVEKFRSFVEKLTDLVEFVEKNGPYSEAAKQRLIELNNDPEFRNDPQFREFYEQLVGK
ncbi:DUF4238 domain-containing protein [Chitinophagaceae bacterium 26-R-25]|nr:DUF4238 domain-containing protein [Chitinophagaceae bacterium 26-R-25]